MDCGELGACCHQFPFCKKNEEKGVMQKRSEGIINRYEQSLAQIVLQCMSELPFDVGASRLCEVLHGSQAKLIVEEKLNTNTMYGILSPYSEDRLHHVISALKEVGLIDSRAHAVYGSGEVLSISSKGQKYLSGQLSVDLKLTENRTTPYQERLKRIRSKHPRAYEPWSAEEDCNLRNMVMEKVSVNEIARVLQRQPSAIRSRIRKLDQKIIEVHAQPVERQAIKPRQSDDGEKAASGSEERRSRIRNRYQPN
jgi:superfamily II DNA helicase RecQ